MTADAETLAAELGCEYHSDGYGVCASCHEQAEQVMDSEWLTNYLADAWDQGYNNGFYDRDLMRTDEARDATEGRSQNPYRQPDTT